MLKKLLKAGGWVFFGILLGRIAGFVRDILVAAQFGKSARADVATLTIGIPDLLLSIIVGGAMGAALIPEFKRLAPWGAWMLHKHASRWVFGLLFPVAAILALGSPLLVKMFGPGFGPEATREATSLLRIVLWAIPLCALVAIDRAFLQSVGNFSVSSMSTVVYNLALVIGLAVPMGDRQLVGLAFAALGGAAANVAIQRFAAQRYKPTDDGQEHRTIERALLVRYGQAFMAGGLLLVLPSVARAVGSLDVAGSLAVVNYALKMVELPLGVVLTVFSVVLFPTLSGLFAEDPGSKKAVALAQQGMRVVLILSTSIALPMAWFSADFARVLFRRGALDDSAAATIGHLTQVAMIGLIAQALYSIVLAVLNAHRDMKSPFYASLLALIIYVPLAVVARNAFGLPGVVVSAVVVYWGVLVGLLAVSHRKYGVNLHATLIDPQTLMSLVACVATFLVFAGAAHAKPLGSAAHVVLAVCAGLTSAIVALLSIGDYRRSLFSRLTKVAAT